MEHVVLFKYKPDTPGPLKDALARKSKRNGHVFAFAWAGWCGSDSSVHDETLT